MSTPVENGAQARHTDAQPSAVEWLTPLERQLLVALTDMCAGWRYIREHHGDLYGVGWDRSEQLAHEAICAAQDRQLECRRSDATGDAK